MDRDLLWMMPDVGDVLGDSSLAEPGTDFQVFKTGLATLIGFRIPRIRAFFTIGVAPMKGTEEGGGELDPRVVHVIDGSGSSFMALSPPPTHLFLEDLKGVHEQSLQHWLSSRALSCLALAHPDAGTLRQMLPIVFSHKYGVRQLELHFQDEEIVDALIGDPSACSALSSHVSLVCYGSLFALVSDPKSAICKLAKKCRSLTLVLQSEETLRSYDAVLLAFITHDCKLQVLRFRYYGEHQSQFFVDDVGVLKKMESCQLKRLDMRELPPLGPEGMRLLVASLASRTCSIQDLGISLASTQDLILAKAFQEGSSLRNLKVLRFSDVDTCEAAACVVNILGSPESNCKVRFLDIEIHEYDRYKPFFKRLQDLATPVRIECLRIVGLFKSTYDEMKPEIDSMSDFLAQQHCSLLWLDCSLLRYRLLTLPEAVQMKLANSLEANFLITSLRITGLDSPVATSRASAFITRNCLYEAMGLSNADFMRPQVARCWN